MKSQELFQDNTAMQLALLRKELATGVYPGYPETIDRFYATAQLGQFVCELLVPDGPWTVNNHPNRPDSETVPSGIMQQQLLTRGYRLDIVGRPIHPWFEDMITDPTIGVTAGKGAYWVWGPNYTADAVVIHRNNLLLVRRKDTGDWAVPGGFIDRNEEVHDA
jgi:hypothetical protein